MAGEDHLRELEARYEDYKVYDNAGEKIGKVDDLFIDEADREEYIGVKMGFFGLSSTLIPMDIVRVDERERIMEVADSRDHVKDAPTFDDDDDITPEFEDRIRRHFGLESMESSAERGSYGRYAGAATGAAADARPTEPDIDPEGRAGRETYRDREQDLGPSESPMEAARSEEATRSGGLRDLETGERDRIGDEGFREGGRRGEEFGDRDDPGLSSGTVAGPGRAEEGMTRRDPGEAAGGGIQDEGYREAYREGYREGFREGLRSSTERGEFGDRDDPGLSSGAVAGAGRAEEGMTRRDPDDRDRMRDEGLREGGPGDRDTAASRPGDEARETSSRRSGDEGEGEESAVARVWRRIRS
jgi:hypothetical protein